MFSRVTVFSLRSDLPHLEYLSMCIKEGMRLHSPVAIVGRETTKPFDLGDTVVPPGTSVIVSCVNSTLKQLVIKICLLYKRCLVCIVLNVFHIASLYVVVLYKMQLFFGTCQKLSTFDGAVLLETLGTSLSG